MFFYNNLDCIIHILPYKIGNIYIDIILSSEIVNYPTLILDYSHTNNYLSNPARNKLINNKYIISDKDGYILNGKLIKKRNY